ncbi:MULTISPECIES: DUF4129 domain-containing protein [unclassified Nocardioides]|uniref:DUF4129 domain-containing protein n=1 Tax=unclassified Nocardioides TaxID=2615069 RepID=UPI0006FE60B7|nr:MULTISPECIES: DUF4129 domain-containing protein [unclassified Nocardioides]KRA38254.1 hypothetical protein ASD81_06300 [Nocardioides sp. Root614]KRA92214.1 hypothetical protein ASD84_06565 [Nocardioides sp. Root682]
MIAVLALPLLGRLDPPLDPSGDEARGQLRRELAHPEYYDANLLERISDWLDRLINGSVSTASDAPLLTVVVAILVALLLLAGMILIVSRARRTARADQAPTAALTDEVITADQLRARAEAALAAGDPGAALIDAFRAVAVRQIERGRIDDVPQATAHELAGALAVTFADHGPALRRGADLFDQVLYGDRPATVEQARDLLALDDRLAGRTARR